MKLFDWEIEAIKSNRKHIIRRPLTDVPINRKHTRFDRYFNIFYWEGREQFKFPFGNLGDILDTECGQLRILGVKPQPFNRIRFHEWVQDFCPTNREIEIAIQEGQRYFRKKIEGVWSKMFKSYDLFAWTWAININRV